MKHTNYINFLKEYKQRVKISNGTIINAMFKTSIVPKINKASITLSEGKEEIFDFIKMDTTYRGGWLLVAHRSSQSLDPEHFTLNGSIVFDVDEKNKRIFHDMKGNENLPGDNWYLVKTTPYFEIRNSKMLIEKFELENFSEIDKLLLGMNKLSKDEQQENNKTVVDPLLDKYQLQAFNDAINAKNLAVIKGPPGTGKTFTISRIIKYYNSIGKKVLFASALHSSLDALITKINNSPDLQNLKVWRSSSKAHSVFPKGITEFNKNPDVFVTTFASYLFNGLYDSRESNDEFILIIDEASANNLFNVFSKTRFAEKVIIVGDDAQLYPIYNDSYKKYMDRLYKKEFKLFFVDSLFDKLYKINKNKMSILLNNYRSEKSIVDVVNFFYKNNLTYAKEDTTQKVINTKSFDSISELRGGVEKFAKDFEGQQVLYISYYKSVIEILNTNLKGNPFRTSLSVQGVESDVVLLVLCKKNPGMYKHQLDYRNLNVAMSRARKHVYIYYMDDLLDLNMIKRNEGESEYFKFGDLYSLKKVIKEQKDFNSKKNDKTVIQK